MGVYGPYLPDVQADFPINCGNEEHCPMGDTGTISVNAGAGPSLTVHISPAFRLTIDTPFSVLVQAQEAKFNGGVGALERTQNQHVVEDVCNPRYEHCAEILPGDSSSSWTNNAYSYDALGPGHTPIGLMGSIFIQLEFGVPRRECYAFKDALASI